MAYNDLHVGIRASKTQSLTAQCKEFASQKSQL